MKVQIRRVQPGSSTHVRSITSSFSFGRRCPCPRSIFSNVERPLCCMRLSLTDKSITGFEAAACAPAIAGTAHISSWETHAQDLHHGAAFILPAGNENAARLAAISIRRPRWSDPPSVERAPADDVAHELLQPRASLLDRRRSERPQVAVLRHLPRYNPHRQVSVPRPVLVDGERLQR